jgi:hypothetical protein
MTTPRRTIKELRKALKALKECIPEEGSQMRSYTVSVAIRGLAGIIKDVLDEIESIRGCEQHDDCAKDRELAVACIIAQRERAAAKRVAEAGARLDGITVAATATVTMSAHDVPAQSRMTDSDRVIARLRRDLYKNSGRVP